MKKYLRFLPLALIPMGLGALLLGLKIAHHPLLPDLILKGYQSFISVLMLLMQF
jgi:hypothetical protein